MNKKVELYQHNAETYDKLINMLGSGCKKVAIVQPTGTGKSFVSTRYLQDNPTLKKLVMSPSDYINVQFKELQAKEQLEHTDFMTYTKLHRMSPKDRKARKYDIIVLDEFHRCGAQAWQKSITESIDNNKNAVVIGASATPIRHLDGARDMVEELFDGNIIQPFNLAGAILKGILPTPKYITALYKFDEEIEKQKRNVENGANCEHEKQSMKDRLDDLRVSFSKSHGIPRILEKHLPSKDGKYIVFCKDTNHQAEMKDVVSEWFIEAINVKPTSYVVNSDKGSKNRKIIKDFQVTKSKGIHLLFAVNMLNEGIHLESGGNEEGEITGVIFLRKTKSYTVFFQQLGRALSVTKTLNPIVFDFVNNVNLRHAQEVKRELTIARISGEKCEGKVGVIINDETIDFVNQISKVLKNLFDTWDEKYTMLTRYKEKYGNLLVPQKYIIGGVNLGEWVNDQRKNYNSKTMPQRRIDKLEAIGFIWNVSKYNWDVKYSTLLRYKEKHGDTLVPCGYKTNNIKLGAWIDSLRTRYKKANLSQEKIDKLEAIGFAWYVLQGKKYGWDQKYEMLVRYKEKHGNILVPKGCTVEGANLWSWINAQRTNYKKNSLSRDKIDKLEAIGFIWSIVDEKWEKKYSMLVQYKEENGSTILSRNHKNDGINLWNWVHRQKKVYRRGDLSQERIDKLEAIDFSWRADWTFQ